MATLEQLIEEARLLLPDEQRQLREALEREARLALIRQVQAKYALMKISSADLSRNKAEEIELEDRHFRRRKS